MTETARHPSRLLRSLGLPALASTTVVLLLAGKAARGDASASAPANVRHVRVVVAGPADDAATLRASLQELLARIGADLVLERVTRAEASAPTVDGAHRNFATIGVDLEAEGETRVVVADGRGDVRMHRSVPRAVKSDKRVALEEASHVVQSAVEALEEEADEAARPPRVVADASANANAAAAADADADAGAADASVVVAAAPAPAPAPSPAPAPPIVPPPIPAPIASASSAATTAPRDATQTTVTPAIAATAADVARRLGPPTSPSFALDLVGAFELGGYGSGSGIVLAGAAGAVLHAGVGAYRPSLWLLGEYHGAFSASEGSASVDVTTISVRALPAMDLVRARSWRIEAAVGGGIDILAASPRKSNASTNVVHLSNARADVDPIVSAMIAAHTEIARDIDAFAAFRLDGDLAPTRYESDEAGMRTTLFDPWRFRPALLLGVSWGVVGPTEYPARAESAP